MVRYYLICLLFFIGTIVFCQPMINATSSAGIDIACGLSATGFGLSFADFNKDGYDDITFGTESGDSIVFYQNNGNGTFTKLFPLVLHTGFARQLAWVDIDNDDDLDFFVCTENGSNKLFEKTSTGFVDITASSGISTAVANNSGASFGDFDKDGDLDLYISVYGITRNYFYRNNGNKTFTDITAAAGISLTPNLGFCATFFDYDNDGNLDLYAVVDRTDPNLLYKNNGNGTFTEVGSVSQTGAGIVIDAMNGGVGDFNNDGFSDIYVTNTYYPFGANTGNNLLLNFAGAYFPNVGASSGVDMPGQTSWGASWLDVNNDKYLDLYVSTEHINATHRNRLFKNNKDETFTEFTSTGLAGDTLWSYANAVGDYNNDGKPDIVVSNANDQKSVLWKNNTSNANNFIKLELKGTTSNKNAIGSRIDVWDGDSLQMRFTHCGTNYISQNSLVEHIGMGNNTSIDSLIVKWPNGGKSKYYNIGVNTKYTIIEGTGCFNNNFDISTNTVTNKYIGTNGNLMQASNWSKNMVPNLNDDAEINNSSASLLSLQLNTGSVLKCRSLVLKGLVSLVNFGTIELHKSYGDGLYIESQASFDNKNIFKIMNPCQNAMTLLGMYKGNGTSTIIK
jgi:FG-GAP-like repeat/ASPIC and UnbV